MIGGLKGGDSDEKKKRLIEKLEKWAKEHPEEANVEQPTKKLHFCSLTCSTNAAGGLGETVVKKGCFSWLGYTEPVYAAKSQWFNECIWSYMETMAEGKTMEQCEQHTCYTNMPDLNK